MTHASDSEPSLISAAERSEARFIKLVYDTGEVAYSDTGYSDTV